MLHSADRDARHGRLGHEVIRQAAGERLDVSERILSRQRVHRILHRVGGDARRVVALDVDRVERALELDVDRQVDELVRRIRAAAAGP